MASILIVDDEPRLGDALQRALELEGHHAQYHSDPELALQELRARPFDVVLTDLVMPGMGGIGLLRALRERACRAPIVMMSGYVGESASEAVAGVSAWVQKPVSARRLGQIIQEALT